jgi:hypothetical protein
MINDQQEILHSWLKIENAIYFVVLWSVKRPQYRALFDFTDADDPLSSGNPVMVTSVFRVFSRLSRVCLRWKDTVPSIKDSVVRILPGLMI